MVIIVVVINILISLMLLYLTWRVCKLRRQLADIADLLIVGERSINIVLLQASLSISISQRNIHNLRQGNQSLQVQIQGLQQILSLLVAGQQVWLRAGRKFSLKLATIRR